MAKESSGGRCASVDSIPYIKISICRYRYGYIASSEKLAPNCNRT